jgi:hypothetical protein
MSMETWQEQLDARKAKAKEYLLTLAPKIKALEYQYLVGFFDGSGDTGQVEKVLLSNEEAALYARFDGDLDGDEEIPLTIFDNGKNELDEFIWDLTPDGFENDAGGYGAIILDCEAGTIRRNYSYRVEDSAEDDTEL